MKEFELHYAGQFGYYKEIKMSGGDVDFFATSREAQAKRDKAECDGKDVFGGSVTLKAEGDRIFYKDYLLVDGKVEIVWLPLEERK